MSSVTLRAARAARISGVFVLALGVLYAAIALPKPNEVTHMIPYALLPIAALLGIGGWVFEITEAAPPFRRDVLFGLSAAVAIFALLRLARVL